MAGITGRAVKSEGNLISTAGSLLTSIYQANPIWVRFCPGRKRSGPVPRRPLRAAQDVHGVELVLPDGSSVRPSAASSTSLASQIDPTLGTQQLARRVRQSRAASAARPVRARRACSPASASGVFLVPQAAVVQTEQGPLVMTVGADNKVAPRPVKTGEWYGKDWVILGGLKAGDKVIVDNLIKLRPGAPGRPARAGRGPGAQQAGDKPQTSATPAGQAIRISHGTSSSSTGRSSRRSSRSSSSLPAWWPRRCCPIAQYPQIAPPTVLITATYPGASAETLAKTVAAPIEEQLNGVENMVYFTSSASANGSVTITATFEVGTNVDMAAVNVNNRVKAAEPRLPETVRRNGVIVQKRSNDILQVVALKSEGGKYPTLFLSNYASLNIVDELKRLKGVGDVTIFGAQDYSMRVWLKPDRMAQLGMTTTEVANAITAQNAQNAAGKIGQEPAPNDQQLVYTVTAKGRLLSEEEFGNIVIRASGPGGLLRLKDVARIELGAYSYDQRVTLDGQPTIAMGVFLQTGANALEVADLVKAKMAELKGKFPEGMDYVIPFDTTRFVSASINEVVKTLIEAMVLVLAVVFIFLQSWRATLIPMVAVPISLIGTFAGLWLFGFSINTLTLFAMVLAIGIVVDDAIVVLENVERLMAEEKLPPKAGRDQGHAAGDRRADRHRAGALRGVRSGGLPWRHRRPVVQAVCRHRGGRRGALRRRRADPDPGPVRPAAQGPAHREQAVSRPFNRLFERLTNNYTNGCRLHAQARHHRHLGLCPDHWRYGLLLPRHRRAASCRRKTRAT